jgi:hypothetical protein
MARHVWMGAVLVVILCAYSASAQCDALVPGTLFDGSFESGTFLPTWISEDIDEPFLPQQIAVDGVTPNAGIGGPFFSSEATDGTRSMLNGFDGGRRTGGRPFTRLRTNNITNPLVLRQDIPVLFLAFDWRAAWDLQFQFAPNNNRTFYFAVHDQRTEPVFPQDFEVLLLAELNTTVRDTGPQTYVQDISRMLQRNGGPGTIGMTFVWQIPEIFSGPAFFQLDNIRLLCCEEGNIPDAVNRGYEPENFCLACPDNFGNTNGVGFNTSVTTFSNTTLLVNSGASLFGTSTNLTEGFVCYPCPCGNYSESGSACDSCINELIANDVGSGCFQCPAGQQPAFDRCGCEPCEPGFFSPDGSRCDPCPENQFASFGAAECSSCGCGSQPNATSSGCSYAPLDSSPLEMTFARLVQSEKFPRSRARASVTLVE